MRNFILIGLLLLGLTANLQAQTPYYQGKTIRFIVGYPAGSTHDLWARLVGSYMSKYIPGNPNIIVQDMPGAGSAVAANYVYTVAKPDGLSTVVTNAGLYFDQLLGRKEVQYDWAKFAWIGSSTRSHTLMYMAAKSPYASMQDIRSATTPPKCGSTGTGNSGYYIPKLLEETIGAKFQIVSGYQGGADVDLAAERGEIQCRAISIPVFFGREPYHTWRKTGFARVLFQMGHEARPALTGCADLERIDGPISNPCRSAPPRRRRRRQRGVRRLADDDLTQYIGRSCEDPARGLHQSGQRPGAAGGSQKENHGCGIDHRRGNRGARQGSRQSAR